MLKFLKKEEISDDPFIKLSILIICLLFMNIAIYSFADQILSEAGINNEIGDEEYRNFMGNIVF